MDVAKILSDKGYVVIDNFLPYQQANQLRQAIIKQSHHRAWGLLTTPYRPNQRIRDNIDKNTIDKLRHKIAVEAHKRKQFAFSFYRSANKHESSHHNRRITEAFTKPLVEKICPELSLEGELTDAFFASYIKDQFIGYHSDGSAGKYAFIYQLSKGWQKRLGGELVLYPKRQKFYKKFIQPTFNTLVLLRLDHPMYHSVTKLNTKPHQHRITISGWLKS